VPSERQFVATSLDPRQSEQRTSSDTLVNIGMVRGDKRSQMLALRLQHELALTAGNSTIPLADLVSFEDGSFAVDAVMVRQMVDTAPPADSRHTPTIAKREVRKADTQAIYADWQKEYRKLLKAKPGNTQNWYAKQIEKMPIAQGRNYSTIKKHMHRSGPGNLNDAISGNSWHEAWPKMAGHEGVFDGQEISTTHASRPHPSV
jgi:hypothetical protein